MAFKILCIDGGGIRGVIPAIWLSCIQKILTKPLSESFDLICGTSTGSIIAAAAALDMEIDATLNLYEEFGRQIFPSDIAVHSRLGLIERFLGGPIYDEHPLTISLQRIFGITTKLNEVNTKLFIPSYDVFNSKMFNFSSYSDYHCDISIWEACKASSSAPTYFPAHILERENSSIPLVDGGLFANNPTLLALSEAINIYDKESMVEFEKERKIIVVSLGTGNIIRRISTGEAKTMSAMKWIKPVIDAMFDSSSAMAEHCAMQIVKNSNYVRMQIDLIGIGTEMDDSTQENINKLKAVAQSHLETSSGKDQINKIKSLIC